MNSACLVNLGFHGDPYTWTNAREGVALIRKRLGRALVNHSWNSEFLATQVSHLQRTYSDHCPLCIDLHASKPTGKNFPFRCKEVWLAHSDFKNFFIQV